MTLPPGSVFFDAQGAQSPEHRDRGIARYTVEQIRAVTDLAPEAVGGVALSPLLPSAPSLDFLLGRGVLHWSDERRPRDGVPPRIWHVVSPFEVVQPLRTMWPQWARTSATRLVVTLYDLIPLLFEGRYLQEPQLRARYLTRLGMVRAAHGVLAISQTTADDAIEHLGLDPARVSVIDAGVSDAFRDAFASPSAARDLLDKRLRRVRPGFLLYVGGIDFRKNVETLVEGYARMPAELRAAHQLVIACRVSDHDRERLEQLAVASGARPGELLLTGLVTDEELAALYHLTRLFVFASFYEGSGLPILEAMSCGAPVAASNTSTSPEILGDLDATFDPHDPADIARVLAETVASEERLEALRARSAQRVAQYTWRHVGERTIAGYEGVLSRVPHRRPTPVYTGKRRRRIAWATPWPPERSGVASYTANLVKAMAEHVDVDVHVSGRIASYETPPAGVRLLPISSLGWRAGTLDYDQVFYAMGNSHFHHEQLRALERQPGIVVAHDVRFGGLYSTLAVKEHPEDPWGEMSHQIWRMYGHRVDVSKWRWTAPTVADQVANGLYMTHDIQRWATSFIVHSHHAADILRLDAPPDLAERPEVRVLPHAFPDPPTRPRRPEPGLIVSFGLLDPAKGLARLIEAMPAVIREIPHARLVLAGGSDSPAAEQHWRDVAAEHGVADHVEVTGYLSRAAYDDFLDRASVAVQLRETSNGEASGAIVDCLSRGIPTIATESGWTSELPPSTYVPVGPGVSWLHLGKLVSQISRASSLNPASRVARSHGALFDSAAAAYLSSVRRISSAIDG